MDNDLVPANVIRNAETGSLNPYCSGQWSSTILTTGRTKEEYCLNPCCSGLWSSTRPYKTLLIINKLKNFTKEIFTFLN